MKKKSIAARLGLLALVLTLVTTSLSSGTLAKYTTEQTISGVFKAATWDVGILIKDKDGDSMTLADGANDIKTFNLKSTYNFNYNHIYGDTKVIAPGTSGKFQVVVTNNATQPTAVGTQVDALYSVKIAPSDPLLCPGNLYFTTQIGTGNSTSDPIYPAAATQQNPWVPLVENARLAGGTANSQTIYIEWVWPYDDDGGTGSRDDADNAVVTDAETGKAIDTQELSFNIQISAVQEKPQASA